MNYGLVNKKNLLKYLLGDIDQIDITYTFNNTYNRLLICLNNNLLNILYKYDQYSSNYVTDQTDTGDNYCTSSSLEILSDTILKFNISQKFIRCFSYYKEQSSSNVNYTSNNGFISLYPNIFLDFENNDIKNILSDNEFKLLQNSKLISFSFSESNKYQIPTINKTASKGYFLPNNINLISFKDHSLNYTRENYSLTDSETSSVVDIDVQYDSNPNIDKYSKYTKSFNIINDSTIIFDFEIYINLKKYNYLLDVNDVNNNYHINVLGNNIIKSTSFNLSLYEKINNNLNINDIVYIKDIYTDSIISLCEIINITNNDLVLSPIQNYSGSDTTISYMDNYTINKIKNLSNYNIIQKNNNIIEKLLENNLFVINSLNFTESDYLAINNLQ